MENLKLPETVFEEISLPDSPLKPFSEDETGKLIIETTVSVRRVVTEKN